jgi:hypothetical protein
MSLSKVVSLLSWVYAATFWVLVGWVAKSEKENLLDG